VPFDAGVPRVGGHPSEGGVVLARGPTPACGRWVQSAGNPNRGDESLHYSAGSRRFGVGHARRVLCRTGALVVAVVGALAAWGSSAQAAPLTIAVTGDSVLVTGHSGGSTTIQATRPDAVTGRPVVIGQYADRASSSAPFSVNTSVPTALLPNGDCWQQGALSSALTPDLQPGDTVTFTQEAPFGGEATSASVAVNAAMVEGAVGPIPSCRDIAPFARNAVTTRPDSVAGGPITVSGVAQPFATGVTVSASDGAASTAPVSVGPAQDGSWSATIPADQVDRLAGGALTVTPVFDVPDVSTGVTAHIAGAAVGVSKLRAGAGGTSKPGGSSGSGHGPAAMRVASLRLPARISLRRAHRDGIRASFVVPTGARVVRVQLKRAGKVVTGRVVSAGNAGSRQTVRLRGASLRRVLHRGKFRVAVRAGASRAQLGPPVSGVIVIR
jgi:hypothetical protein